MLPRDAKIQGRHFVVAAIVLLALTARLFRLSLNGFCDYHLAAVARSMTFSLHNFFYTSYDPLGFLSSNKPPVAFWLQALSAKLLGFTPLALLLPQVVVGVAGVLALYLAASTLLNFWGAIYTALVLALTPIAVIMDRHNKPDAVLAFLLVLSAAVCLRAIDTGHSGWLLTGAAISGVAFNTKLLEALIPVPAFFLAYVLCSRAPARLRAMHMAAAVAVLLVVSCSWTLAFDLTPVDKRPYAAESPDGKMGTMILAFGTERLTGSAPAMWGRNTSFWNGGAPFGMAAPSAARFLDPTLASQILWLGPLAVYGLLRAVSSKALRPASYIYGGWLLTSWAVFSFSRGTLHSFYTVIMAAPLAMLAGIAIHFWLDDLQQDRTILVLLAPILVNAAWQQYVLKGLEPWGKGNALALWILIALGSAILIWSRATSLRGSAAAICMLALLLAPFCLIWASIQQRVSDSFPEAVAPGTRLRTVFLDSAFAGNRRLIQYLLSHHNGERILIAAANTQLASPIIVEAGQPALAIEGVDGAEETIHLQRLQELVNSGDLRFFLETRADVARHSPRMTWLTSACEEIPAEQWRNTEPASTFAMPLDSIAVLYDCGYHPAGSFLRSAARVP